MEKINFFNEKYEFNWVGKSFAKYLSNIPIKFNVIEDNKWNNKLENKNSGNILIKGDNLVALKYLQTMYKNKIKMIYIDPPYNTHKKFVYNDKQFFNIIHLSELLNINKSKLNQFVKKLNKKEYKHSTWITFMYPRLKIARNLLKDDGVMIISIDDAEYANLKLLCNKIFGEDNVDTMIWKKSGFGRDGKMKNTTTFRKDHEYLIFCFNGENKLNKLREKPNFQNKYGNPDKDPRGPYKAGSISRKESASNPEHENYYTVVSPTGKKFTRQFDIPKEEFDMLNNDILINEDGKPVSRIYWGKKGDAVPAIKIYLDEERTITPYSVLLNKGTTTEGTKEVTAIVGKDASKMRPKPVSLIATLVQLASREDSIILDFFAGTGTTGHAVMQLNAEDGGNRKYILVQLDEPIDPKKNKTSYDFVKNELKVENPTIFEITKERLVRSAKKIIEDNMNILNQKNKQLEKINNKNKKTKRDKEKINKLQQQINIINNKLNTIQNQDLGFKILEIKEKQNDKN